MPERRVPRGTVTAAQPPELCWDAACQHLSLVDNARASSALSPPLLRVFGHFVPSTRLTHLGIHASASSLGSIAGGARGTRTPDLFVANEPRYHLRYSPELGEQALIIASVPVGTQGTWLSPIWCARSRRSGPPDPGDQTGGISSASPPTLSPRCLAGRPPPPDAVAAAPDRRAGCLWDWPAGLMHSPVTETACPGATAGAATPVSGSGATVPRLPRCAVLTFSQRLH